MLSKCSLDLLFTCVVHVSAKYVVFVSACIHQCIPCTPRNSTGQWSIAGRSLCARALMHMCAAQINQLTEQSRPHTSQSCSEMSDTTSFSSNSELLSHASTCTRLAELRYSSTCRLCKTRKCLGDCRSHTML